MELLAVLVVLAALAVVQADIGFYFFQGFQTKNSADSFYVSISASTDRGYADVSSSVGLKFDSKYNFTLANADKYVTNLTATLYQYGSFTPLATLQTTFNQKLFSFNFYVIAHTGSYDALTGTNSPKLSYGVGSDNTAAVTMVGANYFYSTLTSQSTYTPPANYPIYYYPYNQLYTYLYTAASSLSVGQATRYLQASTASLIYENGSELEHKWCTSSSCVTAKSASYAGTGQSFFVVYYGNYFYNNQVGVINFAIPPNTLQVL